MQRVVVGALVREGRVLLVHRRPDKRAYPDAWDLPGGVIEAGESELGALVRELDEELGVQISTDSAAHLCRLTAGAAADPAVLSAWLVREWQGSPTNTAPEEHDDIGWFDLEKLPPPPDARVRTALVDALRMELGWRPTGRGAGERVSRSPEPRPAPGSAREPASTWASS